MSVNSKMTALADEIRELSGASKAMGLDAMATHVAIANTDVATEADLIAQITMALEGKTASSGDSNTKPEQEKTIEITKSGTYEVVPDEGYTLSKVGVLVSNLSSGGITADDIASCTIAGDFNLISETIHPGAFWGQSNITSINAPNATSIEEHSLRSCSNMTLLSAPEVTLIDSYGLAYCSSLTKLDFPKLVTVGTYAFYNCSGVQGKVILSGVTKLPTQSCYGMSNITALDLPVCTNIADQVLRYCSKLDTIILRSPTVCTLGNVNSFYNTPFASNGAGGKLYVPAALVESYKTAAKWSTIFGYGTNEFLAIEDYPEICEA